MSLQWEESVDFNGVGDVLIESKRVACVFLI